MEKSKVWWMDDSGGGFHKSLVSKVKRLFDVAGFAEHIEKGDKVAIKQHLGEMGNTAYLRPVYARAVAEKVKQAGGEPFLVDTTTLPFFGIYTSRTIKEDYILTAQRNGFTEETVGCPVIIGDCCENSRIGTDDVRVDLPEGNVLKEQYVAKAIADADVMIALTHFKGHPIGIYGGAMKNIGVGCASKRGKYNLHGGYHPLFNKPRTPLYELCKGRNECPVWELCEESCPWQAKKITETGIVIDNSKCRGCPMLPLMICPQLVEVPRNVGTFLVQAGPVMIADSARACMKTKKPGKAMFINMVIDVSPWCDCVAWADRPMVPNIGVFASYDPVAIDQVCIEKVRASKATPGSGLEGSPYAHRGRDKFSWASGFGGAPEDLFVESGVRNGMGSREYELIEVEPKPNDAEYTILGINAEGRVLTAVEMAKRVTALYQKEPNVVPPEGFKRDERPWYEIFQEQDVKKGLKKKE